MIHSHDQAILMYCITAELSLQQEKVSVLAADKPERVSNVQSLFEVPDDFYVVVCSSDMHTPTFVTHKAWSILQASL